MIKVTIHKDKNDDITGFSCIGHAGFAQYGKDIVCAAVSVLILNTINSIEAFTSDIYDYREEEKKGLIDFRLTSEPSVETILLLKSLVLGLNGIQKAYGKVFIKIIEQIDCKSIR